MNGLHPQRILVRGTNWLGDAVMTTPALLRLREKFPNAHITLLCHEKLSDLWQEHPAINDIITFASSEGLPTVSKRLKTWTFKKGLKVGMAALEDELDKISAEVQSSRSGDATLSSAHSQIVARSFDLALVLPNSPRAALEVFLARIPRRVGYARPWRNLFLTQAVPARPGAVKMHKRPVAEIKQLVAAATDGRQTSNRDDSVGRVLTNTATNVHQIHEYLHLVAALGANPEPLAPLLFVTHEEISATRKKFGLENISEPIFGLNPGAEYGPAKRWPVERFIAAAQEIQKRTNCVWLLFGGKSDAAITSQIATALHAARITYYDFSSKTTLRELMALLKLCRVLLTNDTGPMHVAAALGTPVVVPFGSTSPELTGPGLPGDASHRPLKSDAPCAPCFLRECPIDFRCMKGISVERVVEATVEVVNGERKKPLTSTI